ncbi:MAG: NAD(P)-binding domain-containing protein [Armatimonadetes bacterium]|nr:NAD(P)-binding domain-containing protein [Armatimonadota bacterium]
MAFEIKKIGIIGAGQMGKGIAHVCAVSGLDVYLLDTDPETLEKALGDIEKGMGKRVARDEITDYGSRSPAMYAIEFRAGTFRRLGIKAGQKVEIPDTVKAKD